MPLNELILDIFRQARFSEETKYGTYSDALYFTDAEYDALTLDDIKAIAQARVDEWAKFVSQPVVAQALSLTELDEIKLALEAQLAEINQKIAELP